MRHPLERIVRWLFGHRHKWQPYRMAGNNGKTIFYCRECRCGAQQIQNAGPMGNGGWQDRSVLLTHAWEQDWLDSATRLPPNA